MLGNIIIFSQKGGLIVIYHGTIRKKSPKKQIQDQLWAPPTSTIHDDDASDVSETSVSMAKDTPWVTQLATKRERPGSNKNDLEMMSIIQPYRIHGTGIFTYIYQKNQPNVGKYTSPMDPMGTNG